ncbi:MAG: peptidoglycan DD-metalloendopeptidase family protein [Anaerolineae bacterium]|nr:peptidoglycan DD-metalloendopeptidase family protein [Anaerolineae bacterium]
MNMGLRFISNQWQPPSEVDFELLRLAKPDTIRTCLFAQAGFDQIELHRRLAQEHPEATFVARLCAPMPAGPWFYKDFVNAFRHHISELRPYVQWFEVHSQPNRPLEQGGFGTTPEQAEAFGQWLMRVLAGLKDNHPWAKWIFPGNQVDPPNHVAFWQALQPLIQSFDAWGVQAAWQGDDQNDPNWGQTYQIAHELLPDMPIFMTEVLDTTAGRRLTVKLPGYLDWFQTVADVDYIQGTALALPDGASVEAETLQEVGQALGSIDRADDNGNEFLTFAVPAPVETPVTDGFDFPVGKPDHYGYYVAAGLVSQSYFDELEAWHTGEDWNRIIPPGGGPNIDLGDPVYAIANGRVTAANFYKTWGNIVLIEHRLPDGQVVWSQYAHLHQMMVRVGQTVQRGAQIGTIGRGDNNKYLAHLHFEIRMVDLPAQEWNITKNRERVLQSYADPTQFINSHRPGREQSLIVDNQDGGFARSPSQYWQTAAKGYRDQAWWTWTVSAEQGEDCIATWTPKLPQAGLYEVFAFVPSHNATTQQARYHITYQDGTAEKIVRQADYFQAWVSLGRYALSPERGGQVRLSDLTSEPYTRDKATRKQIAFDAVKWVLVEETARL